MQQQQPQNALCTGGACLGSPSDGIGCLRPCCAHTRNNRQQQSTHGSSRQESTGAAYAGSTPRGHKGMQHVQATRRARLQTVQGSKAAAHLCAAGGAGSSSGIPMRAKAEHLPRQIDRSWKR